MASIVGMPGQMVPLVNPDSPRAGVYLATEVVFNAASLLAGCFVRNTFGAGKSSTPTGVKVCLRLVAQAKQPGGGYASFTAENAVSLELGTEEIPGFLAVLVGARREYTLHITNSDKHLLVRYQAGNDRQPVYLRLSQGHASHSVVLSYGELARVRMMALATLKVLYPWAHDDSLLSTFTAAESDVTVPAGSVDGNADNESDGADAGVFRLNGTVLASRGHRPLSEGKRKALYAIGQRYRGGGATDTALFLQRTVSDEGAAILIGQFNEGNLSLWDAAAEEVLRRKKETDKGDPQ